MTAVDTRYKPKEVEQLERLLFQTDTLFHNRVNILLITESIFFVAAISVWKELSLVLLLAFLGITTALLCTFTNLKLYWRLKPMIEKFQVSKPFKDFTTYKDVDKYPWKKVTDGLIDRCRQKSEKRTRPVWVDTGWLFTWGFCWVVISGWIFLVLLSVIHCYRNQVAFWEYII